MYFIVSFKISLDLSLFEWIIKASNKKNPFLSISKLITPWVSAIIKYSVFSQLKSN